MANFYVEKEALYSFIVVIVILEVLSVMFCLKLKDSGFVAEAKLAIRMFYNIKYNTVKDLGRNIYKTTEIEGKISTLNHTFYVEVNGVSFVVKYYCKLSGVFQRLHIHNRFDKTGLAMIQRTASGIPGKVWAESKYIKVPPFIFPFQPLIIN